MTHVTATEFQQNVGNYSDAALKEPIIITSHNRDRLVLMGVEEYNRLKTLERKTGRDTDRLIKKSIATHRSTLEKLAER